MGKKITMQDIADRLNISKNSVSQALSGKPGVSEETRKRVQQTAKELGYQYAPRKSANMNSGNIGLIASDFAFSQKNFFGEIYLSVENEVRKRGMNLFIQSINRQTAEERTLPSFIQDRSVDGILILSHLQTEYINGIISSGIPTVLIDHHHPNIHADAILTNNRFGAYTAIQHLIELGHKHIAFVGDVHFSPSYQERWEGYQLALRDYGLQPDPAFALTDAKEDEETIDRSIKRLSKLPSAWFCVNDGLGYLVYSGLNKRGVKVPQEASVCSFDNGQLSQLSRMTSMDIDLQLFGRKAVEHLFWRIEHPKEPIQEILLPARLVKRQTTANAPVHS